MQNKWTLLGGTAALASILASAWFYAPGGTLFYSLGLGVLLVIISIIDIRTLTLPDWLNAAILLLGGVMVWQTRPDAWPHHFIGAVAGYTILVVVELAYKRTRGKDGLGRGDAKLFGALGMWTGWIGLSPILLIASLSGLLGIALNALVRRRKPNANTQIAFGPFIALGGWVVWLGGQVLLPPGLF